MCFGMKSNRYHTLYIYTSRYWLVFHINNMFGVMIVVTVQSVLYLKKY